jgi:RNA recognition motif-containing protein
MPKNYNEEASSNSNNTLFINGLSYETTENEILDFIQEKLSITVNHINLPKYQDSNRNIGYCHVTLDSKEEAESVMSLNGEYLGGRYLKIEWGKGRRAVEQKVDKSKVTSKTVFVKNLPYKTNEDEVGEFFQEKCGNVNNVRLVYNSVHRHFKG